MKKVEKITAAGNFNTLKCSRKGLCDALRNDLMMMSLDDRKVSAHYHLMGPPLCIRSFMGLPQVNMWHLTIYYYTQALFLKHFSIIVF